MLYLKIDGDIFLFRYSKFQASQVSQLANQVPNLTIALFGQKFSWFNPNLTTYSNLYKYKSKHFKTLKIYDFLNEII